jgi:hypothetical protein
MGAAQGCGQPGGRVIGPPEWSGRQQEAACAGDTDWARTLGMERASPPRDFATPTARFVKMGDHRRPR